MYKLVVVGGRLRGEEYTLENGENIIGRSPEADHIISVEGISKKHMRITISNDTPFLEDMGSSNGTFVNGKLTKKLTLKDGDQIALPNLILKVVYVKEKKVIIKKKVGKIDGDVLDTESAPTDTLGRLLFFFKTKVMNPVYEMNKNYEWKHLLGIMLALLTVGNLFLTVSPVLLTVQDLIYEEVVARAEQYADEIKRTNSIYLQRNEIGSINTRFLNNKEGKGVMSYYLFDLGGNIIRPANLMDKRIKDPFTIEARDHFKKVNYDDEPLVNRGLENNEIGVAKVLYAVNTMTGTSEPLGIIAIRFKPSALQTFEIFNKTIYWETFIYTTLLAVLFFGFIYYMTLKPVREAKLQADEVLRGRRKEITSEFLFEEMYPLTSLLNTTIQKNRELMNEDVGDFAEIEEDTTYVATLHELMLGIDNAAIVLNSEKNIEHVNELAGDLTGMRESLVKGSNILDVAQNEGIAGTILKLCDDSANNNGTHQHDFYELEGESYQISVSSLIGKDGFAKAFFITFVKEL